MTLLKMYKECRKLWKWLADHPDNTKAEYFFRKGIIDTPKNECYSCQYVIENFPAPKNNYLECKECPLFPAWGAKTKNSRRFYCERRYSPYYKWERTRESKYAMKIVDFCDKQIEKLRKNK